MGGSDKDRKKRCPGWTLRSLAWVYPMSHWNHDSLLTFGQTEPRCFLGGESGSLTGSNRRTVVVWSTAGAACVGAAGDLLGEGIFELGLKERLMRQRRVEDSGEK